MSRVEVMPRLERRPAVERRSEASDVDELLMACATISYLAEALRRPAVGFDMRVLERHLVERLSAMVSKILLPSAPAPAVKAIIDRCIRAVFRFGGQSCQWHPVFSMCMVPIKIRRLFCGCQPGSAHWG
jgi:hypothetical protein